MKLEKIAKIKSEIINKTIDSNSPDSPTTNTATKLLCKTVPENNMKEIVRAKNNADASKNLVEIRSQNGISILIP